MPLYGRAWMLGVLALIPCSPAAAGTHIGGALTINDSATPPTAAAPYPSTITVSGEKPIVTAISVRVRAFTHPFPEEVDLLLVGPSGQSVLLMSDLGDEPETNEDFTVSDAAPGPGTAVGGSFRPTDLDDEVGDLDDFPAPAPPGPHGSSLGALVAPTANGTWRLYAVDDSEEDAGSIGAWELRITSRDPWTVGTFMPELPPPFGFPETRGTVNVLVERSIGPGLRPAGVSYTTFPFSNSPTPGVDYVPRSGRFEWAAGESGQRVVPVRILDDRVSELQECVGVAFMDPAGDLRLSPGNTQHVCIADDDPPVILPPVPGLTAAKVQRPLRRGGVIVTVKPNHGVNVTASGTIAVPNGAAVVRLKRVIRRVAGGRATALRLRLSSRGRRAVRRAFETRKRLRARVTVGVVDDLGHAATARRKLTLKR